MAGLRPTCVAPATADCDATRRPDSSTGVDANAWLLVALSNIPRRHSKNSNLEKKLLAGRPREVGVVDGFLDLVGMVVDGLTRATNRVGLLGDVAVFATQGGSSVADPGEHR